MELIPYEPLPSKQERLRRLAEKAQEYANNSMSENTRRTYASNWRHFTDWCADYSLTALPALPETVALYITDMAETCKHSTIRSHIQTINQAHKRASHEPPASAAIVRATLSGIRRTIGVREEGKQPLLSADLQRTVEALPQTLVGHRDRALLLVGYGGAFRRSEIVSLMRSDVEFKAQGILITLRRSKTDQEGKGRCIGITHIQIPGMCPVEALRVWLLASGIERGPLFRAINKHGQVRSDALSDRSVALIVKQRVSAVGLDPNQYAGHSLRSGFATSAGIAGAEERSIMKQTGHTSVNMVRRYIRVVDAFSDNAVDKAF